MVNKELFTMEEILENHFSRYGDFDYEAMASYIISDQAHAIQDIWPKRETIDALEKIKNNIREIDRLYCDFPYPIDDAMRHDAIDRAGIFNGDGKSTLKPGEAQERLDSSPSWVAYMAFSDFMETHEEYLPCIDAAIKAVQKGSPEGKKALEAWRFVDALVQLCERHPHTIRVPKSMNSAGDFYRFLDDMFMYFEIETSPDTAFKAWRKHVGSKAAN